MKHRKIGWHTSKERKAGTHLFRQADKQPHRTGSQQFYRQTYTGSILSMGCFETTLDMRYFVTIRGMLFFGTTNR